MADRPSAKAGKSIQEYKEKRVSETINLQIGWQYTIGILVGFNSFLIGAAIGWLSSATPYLETKNFTVFQMAWISSALPLGSAFALFLSYLSSKFIGLKYSILLFQILTGLAWLPLLISAKFYVLLLARLGVGVTAGYCVFCPIYIAEVAHKTHRGTISVFYQLSMCSGMTYAYILGLSYFGNKDKDYLLLNIGCMIWCAILALLTFFLVPQTPYHYLRKGQTENATKLMQRLRGKNYNIDIEIQEITASIEKKESSWIGMKQKTNLKAFGVLLVLHALQHLSGSNVLLYFARKIFDDTGTDINPQLSVILIGVAQVLTSIVAIVAIDRSGRKVLYVVSFTIMCLTIVLVGIFFTVNRLDAEMAAKIGVVPTISLILYICGNSLGDGPLPWTLLGEYLPNSVKELMGTICTFVNYMSCFVLSWLMPVALEHITIDYIFYMFGGFCLLGIIFVLLFLVETNQKTMEEIQNDIANHKIGCPRIPPRKSQEI